MLLAPPRGRARPGKHHPSPLLPSLLSFSPLPELQLARNAVNKPRRYVQGPAPPSSTHLREGSSSSTSPNLGELQLHRADQPEHRHLQLPSSRVLRLWKRGAAPNLPYFLLGASLFFFRGSAFWARMVFAGSLGCIVLRRGARRAWVTLRQLLASPKILRVFVPCCRGKKKKKHRHAREATLKCEKKGNGVHSGLQE